MQARQTHTEPEKKKILGGLVKLEVHCDVCNVMISDTDCRRVSAERFRHLLERGFGINETNVQMLTEVGVSRSQAISLLSEQYRVLKSDWILCAQCFAKAESNLTS